MLETVRWFGLSILTTLLLFAFGAAAQDRPLEAGLKAAFKAGELSGLHNVLIIQNGETLAECHFAGVDKRLGGLYDLRNHGPATLHDLRSVTKSIVGLLYGIALAEGKVPNLDQSLIAQFPEYTDLARDPKRKAILIRHALSMKMGTAWDEERFYSKNSEKMMEYAKDRYRFALDRPMVSEPGKVWVYNGGAVAVIAGLIARGAGVSIDKYAEEKLFKPLGIRDYDWVRGSDGVPRAASGLRLNIHDLAKIGKLILQRGRFRGRQIVPAEWLAASFKPRSVRKDGRRYGYLWSLIPKSWRGLPAMVAGTGNGGQTLAIQPERKLIVVIFAGNYGGAGTGKLPVKIMSEFVVPALKTKREK